MSLDKKVAAKRLRFILLESIGSACISDDVPDALLSQVLAHGDS
jgi:3-dehydroquinate synthetase